MVVLHFPLKFFCSCARVSCLTLFRLYLDVRPELLDPSEGRNKLETSRHPSRAFSTHLAISSHHELRNTHLHSLPFILRMTIPNNQAKYIQGHT
jgi:hypothetical protein